MGTGTGLKGEYYNNTDFTSLVLTRIDPTVNFSWARNAPASGVDPDTFSVRWTGFLIPEFSETYTLYTLTDDGVRLWVNDQLVIDQWNLQGATEYSTSLALEANQAYSIRMEYFDNTKGATAQLLWSSTSQPKGIIPQSQLYPDAASLPQIQPGSLEFSAPTFSLSEDGTPIATVTVQRINGSSGEVSATVQLGNGTATSPADYDPTSITVFFADGDTTPKTLTIPISEDTLIEGNETLNLTLINPTGGATLGNQNTAVLTIIDNDFASSTGTGLLGQYFNGINFNNLALSRTDSTVNFDWGQNAPNPVLNADSFSVRWSGKVEPLYSENYTFLTYVDDGVRLWVDGQLIIDQWKTQRTTHSGTIALQAGQQYNIVMEYFDWTKGAVSQLRWSSPSQALEVIPQSQLYLPDPGQIVFSQPTFMVNEDGTASTAVTVSRLNGLGGDIGATLLLSNGTATYPNDYTALEIPVFFANGDNTPKIITLPILDDSRVESDETLNLLLTNATGGAVIGSQNTAVVTIVDNDSVQSQGTGLTGQYFKGTNFNTLINTRDDSTVNFAWGQGQPLNGTGSDYFSVRWQGDVEVGYNNLYTFYTRSDDGVRLWVNGQQLINNWTNHGVTEDQGQISLEAGQKYSIVMEYYDATGGATAQLLWSSPQQVKEVIPQSQLYPYPRFLLSNLIVNEGDTGITEATLRVRLSAASDQPVTVDYTTAWDTATLGTDYLAQEGTLRFAPGVTEQTITLQILGDSDLTEGDERLWVNFLNPTRGILTQNQAQITIKNDDFLGDLAIPANVFNHHQFANVRDYGAKGDGVTDDTQAILNAMAQNRALYFPNGTYVVSDTLYWADDRRLMIQGENQHHTIIQLANNLEDFRDPNNPKPVLTTFEGGTTGQSFQNLIRNLTIDTGIGNTQAIGLRFLNNNQGGVEDVTIRSSDPNGAGRTGLALTNPWPGPGLIKNVTIEGFNYGIQVAQTEYSNVFENITLNHQKVAGILNQGNILTIRNLMSNSSVPAVQSIDGRGIINLIDSTLNGGAANQSAIDLVAGTLYARNVSSAGYQSVLKNGTTVVLGDQLKEYTTRASYGSSPTSLQLAIENTPEIPYAPLNEWMSVTAFGAIADDGIDDTAAIQAALDSGFSTIYFPLGNYHINNTLTVGGNVQRITGISAQTMLTINNPLLNANQPVFRFVGGHPQGVVLENFFGNYAGTQNFHWIEQATTTPLILRHILTGSGEAYRNTVTGGKLFIEDVTMAGWQFDQQQVWARQLNTEGYTTNIINQGGEVWILGLKTELDATVVQTTDGGRTEVIGGLIYPAVGTIPDDRPAFINQESALSVAGMGESRYVGSDGYTILVEDTQNGVTQAFLNDGSNAQRGNGFLIPLYSSSHSVGTPVSGDSGDNVLQGGIGRQILTGNGGVDIYRYDAPNEGLDLITDWGSDDFFEIVASHFGGGLVAGNALSPNAWIQGSTPTPTSSQGTFLYNTNTGILSYDLDGTGSGVALAIAQLEGIPNLTAHQLILM